MKDRDYASGESDKQKLLNQATSCTNINTGSPTKTIGATAGFLLARSVTFGSSGPNDAKESVPDIGPSPEGIEKAHRILHKEFDIAADDPGADKLLTAQWDNWSNWSNY